MEYFTEVQGHCQQLKNFLPATALPLLSVAFIGGFYNAIA